MKTTAILLLVLVAAANAAVVKRVRRAQDAPFITDEPDDFNYGDDDNNVLAQRIPRDDDTATADVVSGTPGSGAAGSAAGSGNGAAEGNAAQDSAGGSASSASGGLSSGAVGAIAAVVCVVAGVVATVFVIVKRRREKREAQFSTIDGARSPADGVNV